MIPGLFTHPGWFSQATVARGATPRPCGRSRRAWLRWRRFASALDAFLC